MICFVVKVTMSDSIIGVTCHAVYDRFENSPAKGVNAIPSRKQADLEHTLGKGEARLGHQVFNLNN